MRMIYFDYHGVLDHRGYRGMMKAMISEIGRPEADVLPELEPIAYAYASGRTAPPAFWTTIAAKYGRRVADAGKRYYLHVDPNRVVWELVNELRDHVDLGLATDASIDKKQVIRHGYDLPEFFDHLIFSCDVGQAKRDPGFYRLMTRDGLYQPDDVLLIDDDERNTAMATTLGIPSHTYTNIDALRKHLRDLA